MVILILLLLLCNVQLYAEPRYDYHISGSYEKNYINLILLDKLKYMVKLEYVTDPVMRDNLDSFLLQVGYTAWCSEIIGKIPYGYTIGYIFKHVDDRLVVRLHEVSSKKCWTEGLSQAYPYDPKDFIGDLMRAVNTINGFVSEKDQIDYLLYTFKTINP